MAQLIKKIKITTKIMLVSGLHIGGSSDNVEIGGIDNPVIKIATKNNQPYIPGSSLKGKMRCLLEQIAGRATVGGDTEIDYMFGSANARNPMPSKIIVRDAYLSEESVRKLTDAELDMPYTENKFENVIDRITGTAKDPRQTERVPAGVEFNVEFVLNVWDADKESAMIEMLKKGINALENDYLGGSGSRGYGQVSFDELKFTELSEANNWKE